MPASKTYMQQYRFQSRLEALQAYSEGAPQCACPGCTENRPQFLTIDHTNSNGASHRKELGNIGGNQFYRWLKNNHYPAGYRVLCYNCNSARGAGKCPVHEEQPSKTQKHALINALKDKTGNVKHHLLAHRIRPISTTERLDGQKICKWCQRTNDETRFYKGAGFCAECQKEYMTNYRLYTRLKTIIAYGGKKPQCACPGCTQDKLLFLTIDHINNGGTAHKKQLNLKGNSFIRWLSKNNYPAGYRILCHNCNMARGTGKCPVHE